MTSPVEQVVHWSETLGGVLIRVYASARARRDAVVGIETRGLRVAVTAPPEKGKANKAIAALLAKALKCSRSKIQLISGNSSRNKTFLVTGIDLARVQQALQQFALR